MIFEQLVRQFSSNFHGFQPSENMTINNLKWVEIIWKFYHVGILYVGY